MNRIQYRRWKDFALRMADNGFPSTIIRTKQYKEIVRPAIEHFFELLNNGGGPAIIQILSWDDNRHDYRGAEEFPWGFRPEYIPFCIGDEVTNFLYDYWNPFRYTQQYKYDRWDDKWGSRIRCCLRAGLDLVAESSAGVVGFTKGDIERMYPKGVPEWIKELWGQQNRIWRQVDWEEIKKEDGLWL